MGAPPVRDADGRDTIDQIFGHNPQAECRETVREMVEERQPVEPDNTTEGDRRLAIAGLCRNSRFRTVRDEDGNRRRLPTAQWHERLYQNYQPRVQERIEIREHNAWKNARAWNWCRDAITPTDEQAESLFELSVWIMAPINRLLEGIFGGPEEAPARTIIGGTNTFLA